MTLKLLVADDSVTIQKMVRLAFEGENVAIEAVSDGNSAWESLRTLKPDIVLADVFMPGCSGYEVCARIKEDPELNHIPVVLLVGTFEPFDESEASRVQCDGHLTKPFDTSELIQTVQRLVGDRLSFGEAETQEDFSMPRSNLAAARRLVSRASLESFLGENRILELLDAALPAAEEAEIVAANAAASTPVLPEETLNLIVDRVIRKMSPEIVREVAWEVVPELSETIIRRILEERENGNSGNQDRS